MGKIKQTSLNWNYSFIFNVFEKMFSHSSIFIVLKTTYNKWMQRSVIITETRYSFFSFLYKYSRRETMLKNNNYQSHTAGDVNLTNQIIYYLKQRSNDRVIQRTMSNVWYCCWLKLFMSKFKTVTSIYLTSSCCYNQCFIKLKEETWSETFKHSTLIQVPVTSRANLSGVNRSFLLWKLLSLTIINF